MRRTVAGVLLAVVALTGWGMIALWPSAAAVAGVLEEAQRVTGSAESVRGEVLSVADPCEPEVSTAGVAAECGSVRVGILDGPDAGRLVTLPLAVGAAAPELNSGDLVHLAAAERVTDPGVAESPARAELRLDYALVGPDRTLALGLLALLFAGVVIAVGRKRGLLALLALGVSAAVIFFFVLPGLVAGGPGLLIGLVGSTAIMFVTLFFVHGWNLRTAAALLGTVFGILMVAGLSLLTVAATRLTGVADDAAGLLTGAAGGIDLRGVLMCSILIAGLGVLNDITIAQASSVWELRAAAPGLARRELYARAMRIGRDHIASTVYTVVFAYVGAALTVLLVLYLADAPLIALLSREDFAIEIVRTLAGSVGLVLAVPVTTALAAWLVPAGELERA